jgi:dihydroceramidase
MMDELPMLYLVIWIVHILLRDVVAHRVGRWLPWALAAYACFVTYLCVFTRGQVEFYVFQVGFGALELFCLSRVYLLQRRSSDLAVRRLFERGITAYVVGIVAWFVDLKLCDLVSVVLPEHGVPNPELHAVWHVLVSYGFYSLLLVVAHTSPTSRLQPSPQGRS